MEILNWQRIWKFVEFFVATYGVSLIKEEFVRERWQSLKINRNKLQCDVLNIMLDTSLPQTTLRGLS